MIRSHGPWKIIAGRLVYSDPFVQVQLDDVIRPDGKAGNHVVVHMKPGVCVLPMDRNGQVHLTREFHYAIGRESLEGVSGGIEPGETPIITARRELQEELGLSAATWRPITVLDPFTTIIRSPTSLFLAQDLTPCEPDLEGTERIERVAMPLAEALQRVRSGEISHGPTCVLILMASLPAGE